MNPKTLLTGDGRTPGEPLLPTSTVFTFPSREGLNSPTRTITTWLLVILGGLLFPFQHITHALSSSPPLSGKKITLTPVVSRDLEQPVFLTYPNDQSNRLFVVEQVGRIRILQDGKLLKGPFLDIAPKVYFGGERGLLGMAFHPGYQKNGRYVVNYTRQPDGATVISEFQVSKDPTRSHNIEKILLVIAQPYGNHNGGMVGFGPDGLLYIGMGDGGAGGDPENRGQNPSELLGKILRIDINRGTPYAIPKRNPFSGTKGRSEIFALGFRNPWRFSFDRVKGTLWAGDVGQNKWEEIDKVEIGKNYGWRIMEGSHCYSPSTHCQKQGLTPPVTEYRTTRPRCAVTGGYVYRGRQIPDLTGTYVFGDFCSGEILGYHKGKQEVLLLTELKISSFGEDQHGELYVIGLEGNIHRLTATRPQSDSRMK